MLAYLADCRKILRRRYDVISTGLEPEDPKNPDQVVILAQFATPRRLLAPVDFATTLAAELRADVQSSEEQEDIVRYTLRPFTLQPQAPPVRTPISTEQPRVIPVHTPAPLVDGEARVLVSQVEIRHLVKLLKMVKGARKGTPLLITADRPNVLTFTGATLGVTIPCEGTWSQPIKISLKHFRDLSRAIPPDDPIEFAADFGNLVIGKGLTIYKLGR